MARTIETVTINDMTWLDLVRTGTKASDKPADKKYKAMDNLVPGFGVRRIKTGPQYFFKYRSPTERDGNGHKKDRFVVLSGEDSIDARRRAKKYRETVEAGIEPRPHIKRIAAREGYRMQKYIDEFYDAHKHSWKAATRRLFHLYLYGEIADVLGDINVRDVKTRHIRKVFNAVLENRGGAGGGVPSANLCYDVCRALFNFTIAEHEFDISNPCKLTQRQRQRQKLKKHHCVLTDKELKAIRSSLDRYRELGGMTPTAADCVELLRITGMRSNEARTLQWSAIDFNAGVITFEDTKTGPSRRQMNDAAIAFLKTLKKQRGNPYVFPGAIPGQPIGDLRGHWRRIRKTAGMDHLRLHDLRHSWASRLAMRGVNAFQLMKLGGWRSINTVQRYVDIAEDDALRDAANLAAV